MFPSAPVGGEKAAKAAGKETSSPTSGLMGRYRSFCYHLIGERIDREGKSELLAEDLKRAGINSSPGMWTAVSTVTLIISVPAVCALSVLLFLVVLDSPSWGLYTLAITLVTFAAVALGFRFQLRTRIANRKDQLERELPFTLSELSVLASTGTSPIQLVRRMAIRDHDPAMTGEFKRVVYKTDIQGKDLITALAETAKESPSNVVREAFWDLANMIHQGGNLDEYLRTKSDDVLKLKRLVQKEFIERLSTVLDMYVALVLVGVLMIAVAAFLLNSLGQTAAGFSSDELLLLLTFGIVPLSVIMTTILISVAYSRSQ